jgi:hypothetical protein
MDQITAVAPQRPKAGSFHNAERSGSKSHS